MIVLDTNVVSELMRPLPNPAVEAWVADRAATTLFLSAVSGAELLYGIAIMPAGQRRDALETEVEAMLCEIFAGRVLPFDSDAARAYARIAASCRASGRPVSQSDGQIAAVARSRGMAVATRNIRQFEGMAVDIIDPWAGC
ncbi:type II toxin-antitoxin system VapC family toxin [Candidatus Poriferisocius sp.]|uniref:type II toxin-antitoxin system VapC family toxin n=1 Tax=Candidatus Poriferisocius sp. TaxID=3101276 RepID=UPI003B0119E4